MTLVDLPDEGDWSAIFSFAMTFNGYEHYGSFDASAAAAKSGDRTSLELIRNELFFAARASRHCGDDLFLQTYHDLLPLLRQHASAVGKVR
ncbi:hypothetical protein F4693_000360 [Sphingomonas endophytica]|uniref:Uncharacterized protein n=1 Tax=Sphingomonas endophytica TaxID=869719 RepID=A0A7X0JAR4_9SPHN|nr:hypothetical protein [Sphingomonas endophytica]MBB6503407.1 hypothetical protein [Sphingomonas endophytica]